VNLYLSEVNTEAHSAVLYVLDTRGLTLAASNWNEEASFVGMDLSYRPYFHDAVEHGTGRFYGIGTTSGKPGFYYSQAIRDRDEVIGVAVVKVSLDHVEQAWSGGGDIALVVDASGVVFLASDPEWKFRRSDRCSPRPRAAIREVAPICGGKAPRRRGSQWNRLRSMARACYWRWPMPARGAIWSLHINARAHLAIDPADGLLAGQCARPQHGSLHRRRARVRISSLSTCISADARSARNLRKGALQRATTSSSARWQSGTADLVAANGQLGREVAERQRGTCCARRRMRLVQAGKLAVLGQMAAGITHELTSRSPLRAFATMPGFCSRRRVPTMSGTTTLISQLTDRMAKITGQLKAFARKSTLRLGPCRCGVCLANVRASEQRLRTEGVAMIEDWSEDDVEVRAEANRLEQVLVNLIVNALDAMQDAAVRRLEVSVREREGRVSIAVRDTGQGIAPDLLPRIFEPFFTTKAPGKGLGLGLAISAGIIRDFGGSLVAANRSQGGAEFTIELASALETYDA
jgi:two-component system C4-dicarboxylate transport sensor histidine kinase DctB